MRRIIGILGLLAVSCVGRPAVEEVQSALSLVPLSGATMIATDLPAQTHVHQAINGNLLESGGVLTSGANTTNDLLWLGRQPGAGSVSYEKTHWSSFATNTQPVSTILASGVSRVFNGWLSGGPAPTPAGFVAGPVPAGCANWYFPGPIVRFNDNYEAWVIQSSCDTHYVLYFWATYDVNNQWVTPDAPDGSGFQNSSLPLIAQDPTLTQINLGNLSCPHAYPMPAGTGQGLQYTMYGGSPRMFLGIYRTPSNTTAYLCASPDNLGTFQNAAVLVQAPNGQFYWLVGQNFYRTIVGGPRSCTHFTGLTNYATGGTDVSDGFATVFPVGIAAKDATASHLCALDYVADIGAATYPTHMLFTDVDSKVANLVFPANPGP